MAWKANRDRAGNGEWSGPRERARRRDQEDRQAPLAIVRRKRFGLWLETVANGGWFLSFAAVRYAFRRAAWWRASEGIKYSLSRPFQSSATRRAHKEGPRQD